MMFFFFALLLNLSNPRQSIGHGSFHTKTHTHTRHWYVKFSISKLLCTSRFRYLRKGHERFKFRLALAGWPFGPLSLPRTDLHKAVAVFLRWNWFRFSAAFFNLPHFYFLHFLFHLLVLTNFTHTHTLNLHIYLHWKKQHMNAKTKIN